MSLISNINNNEKVVELYSELKETHTPAFTLDEAHPDAIVLNQLKRVCSLDVNETAKQVAEQTKKLELLKVDMPVSKPDNKSQCANCHMAKAGGPPGLDVNFGLRHNSSHNQWCPRKCDIRFCQRKMGESLS